MLNKLSFRWKITITIAVLMFFIFTICNIIQLVSIQMSVINQQQHRIEKRLNETSAYLDEEYKSKRPNANSLIENKSYFEKIIQNNEMIRLLDKDGNVIFTVSRKMPKIHINKDDFGEIQKYRLHNQEILITSKSLHYGNFHGILEVAMNVEIFTSFVKEVFIILIFGTILALILSIFSGYFLSKKLLNPIKNLNQTMMKIKNNQLKERVIVGETKDELSELGLIFNKMMDELEASITRQKRFVEDASHELRTPLAIIHGHLSLVNRWGKKDKSVLENSLNTCINETNRMIILTNELLQLTKLEKSNENIEQHEPTNVNVVLNEIVKNYKLLHEDLEIQFDLVDHVMDEANIAKEHLMQILIILFDNAVKYSKDHTKIVITTSQIGNKIEIRVKDNGIGIKEEDINHIFDRFYRADKARSRANGGNGLGLSIAKNLIENYGGDIQITSEHGEGTTAVISLNTI
ncbi:HAMP domain-containing sensor histidine kinase [Gottfriedia luciferensis]|uniref:HAMP domain-containing sensor histidine kinase n=1 Tax=Gottfriedia luciferensis TaxID=178774 RepID=UPI000B44F7F5|nr:HAMP domain-containing histidine kinase [Gottfriedia luciferensis]